MWCAIGIRIIVWRVVEAARVSPDAIEVALGAVCVHLSKVVDIVYRLIADVAGGGGSTCDYRDAPISALNRVVSSLEERHILAGVHLARATPLVPQVLL